MPDSLSELNLWKKQLGRVPDSVWEQTELESLVLAENVLSKVSEQIGRLKRIRMLDLGHNQLTWLPESLCNREFKVPMTAMKRVADAPEALKLQFAEHHCKGEGAS